jgi:5'-nucleotidase
MGTKWGAGVLLNVNFPDVEADKVEGIEVTDQGKRDQGLMKVDERVDARGNSYYWLGFERLRSNPPRGTDIRAIYDGYISVTPLHMNLTHVDSKAELDRLLNNDGGKN